MVVSAGGVPVGAERASGSRERTDPPERTRREAGRVLLGTTAALALTPLVAASRPAWPAGASAGHAFDETYQGRRIRGAPVPAERPVGDAHWLVTVDGRPLHLMRRADGTWLTMVDHYSSYPTPLEATRAAVDELGPGQGLRDLAPGPVGGGHRHVGGPHGVRA
ncbi:tyrosinase family oxidase copper chaperone [Streptomyces sp. NPDC002514]|uniref:tyrosinase family oxidase copper chaperone n=1 Tax=Streptomyces sp. NPDC001270 TaxID=3364554 RepID=UPI0036B3FBCE